MAVGVGVGDEPALWVVAVVFAAAVGVVDADQAVFGVVLVAGFLAEGVGDRQQVAVLVVAVASKWVSFTSRVSGCPLVRFL